MLFNMRKIYKYSLNIEDSFIRRKTKDDGTLTMEEINKRFRRVSGDVICPDCEQKLWQHPYSLACMKHSKDLILIICCNGILGKL